MEESAAMASSIQVNTLVPLDSMRANVWNQGFRGEVLYYPIEDYGVLPDDVLNDLASKIINRLKCGKKVGLFCLGGHGRTGYVASVVLGKLGWEDPIGFLRENYCKHAVESNDQIRHISKVLDKPELLEEYLTFDRFDDFYGFRFDYLNGLGFDHRYYMADSDVSVCGNCAWMMDGICQIYKTFVDDDELACEIFSKKESSFSK